MTERPRPYDAPPRLPEGDDVALADLFPGCRGDTPHPGGGPVEIEIGPGRGAFIIERCETVAGVRLLGIEIKRKWATLVDERLKRLGLGGRARVVCEDARHALGRLRPDASVERVFIHFPDPWWKKRHTKRLVLVDPLLQQIARLLADGGELFVQTDVAERAEQYADRIGAVPGLVPAGDAPGSPVIAENPYAGRSNRERRADTDGLPVHRLRYRRLERQSGPGGGAEG